MLSVPYSADIPRALIEQLEHHARHHGVSLDTLELVGRTLDSVEAFIIAAEDGHLHHHIATLTQTVPDKVQLARQQAARLFG